MYLWCTHTTPPPLIVTWICSCLSKAVAHSYNTVNVLCTIDFVDLSIFKYLPLFNRSIRSLFVQRGRNNESGRRRTFVKSHRLIPGCPWTVLALVPSFEQLAFTLGRPHLTIGNRPLTFHCLHSRNYHQMNSELKRIVIS